MASSCSNCTTSPSSSIYDVNGYLSLSHFRLLVDCLLGRYRLRCFRSLSDALICFIIGLNLNMDNLIDLCFKLIGTVIWLSCTGCSFFLHKDKFWLLPCASGCSFSY
ncbi:hypothetical protein Dimus_008093 [Dionaea muscipula]